MKIILNGKTIEVDKPRLSYSEVCELANKPTNSSITFSYSKDNDKKGGILSPDCFVNTRTNMKINCYPTGNA